MRNLIIIDRDFHWQHFIGHAEIITPEEYLFNENYKNLTRVRICNLSSSYKYQSIGYYVSLLAEARGHRVFPSVQTIQDIQSKPFAKLISKHIDELIQHNLSKLKSKEFTLSIYFGQNIAKQYEKLSLSLYNLFQSPLLRANFIFKKRWLLKDIAPIALIDVPEEHFNFLKDAIEHYFMGRDVTYRRQKSRKPYDLAILYNPDKELFLPSDARAIRKFIKASEQVGFETRVISKYDYNKIPFFDALFIRDTTAVNHYTYQFSRRAYSEGLLVVDSPRAIIQCTNKVYLDEQLEKGKVSKPKTVIVNKESFSLLKEKLGFPLVLKLPDGSFSKNVVKIDSEESLTKTLKHYFNQSELVIAQQFMPTNYDWRIGIIDQQVIFACQYFMVNNHWQIYKHDQKKRHRSGQFKTYAVSDVPEVVLSEALKTTALFESGFYGVDIKLIDGRAYVIEINDNPNVDSGVEDVVEKDNLYLTIMNSFLKQVKKKKEMA